MKGGGQEPVGEGEDWASAGTGSGQFCAPGSYVSAAITSRPGGGSRFHVTWNRTPTTFTGRLAARLIVASKGRPVAALAKLPAAQRKAMVLRYVADMSVADIAAAEGVPEGTVKSWLSRGRAALAALLGDAGEEGNHV